MDPELLARQDYENGVRSRLADSYREVDRIIVNVSSGVLALSIPLASRESLTHFAVLTIRSVWVLLLMSTLLVLSSLLAEQHDKHDRLSSDGYPSHKNLKTKKLLGFLNLSALISFAAGQILLLIFLFMITSKGI